MRRFAIEIVALLLSVGDWKGVLAADLIALPAGVIHVKKQVVARSEVQESRISVMEIACPGLTGDRSYSE